MKKVKTFERFYTSADVITIHSSDSLKKFFKIDDADFENAFIGLEFDGDDEFEIIMYDLNKDMDLDKIENHKDTEFFNKEVESRRRPKMIKVTFLNKKYQKEIIK